MSEDEFVSFFKDSQYQVAFASCKSDQKSYSSKVLSHGIWSYHIIEALKGNVIDALEKNKFLTANSLQVYLSRIVPITLRKTMAKVMNQTPCMFGNLTKNFILADLTDILREKAASLSPHFSKLKRISFEVQDFGNVKSLSGFLKGHKGHRVPDAVYSGSEKFVAKIGYKDLKEEANALYQKIKKVFAYKRQEIELNIQEGSASINCKDFDVDISLSIKHDDPSQYELRICASNFNAPQILAEKEFNQVFANMFDSLIFEFEKTANVNVENAIDAIERLDCKEIKVEYPGDYAFCTIKIEGLDLIFPRKSGHNEELVLV